MNMIDSCAAIRLKEVTYEKRGVYEGFIRADLYFADGSMLHFREFIDVEIGPERLMYAYQFVDFSKKLIFRYDNTGHHKKLRLPTYPHHKHQNSEGNVIASEAPELNKVLEEITFLITISQ